jgi:hypothetical protein
MKLDRSKMIKILSVCLLISFSFSMVIQQDTRMYAKQGEGKINMLK